MDCWTCDPDMERRPGSVISGYRGPIKPDVGRLPWINMMKTTMKTTMKAALKTMMKANNEEHDEGCGEGQH